MLVEPQLGENIGMVARAMANFGLNELRLVKPRDGWPSEKARAAASGADHVIDKARVYESLNDAIADLQFICATTARSRDMIKPVLGPSEATMQLRELQSQGIRCAILFGRERWGLENDEVALCDAIVTFPVNPDFASLNIAQAVLLMAYEWMKLAGHAPRFGQTIAPANRADVDGLVAHVIASLDETSYFHPPEKRERMALAIASILTRPGFSLREVRTLRGVVAALERRWLKKSGGGVS